MKLAVIGSRNLKSIPLEQYVTNDVHEIVSGGAVGVDSCAAEYARENSLKLTEFLPQYELYGKAAPIVRNKKIVDYSDEIIVFWDGASKGTLSVIEYAKKVAKPCTVYRFTKNEK